MLLKTLATALAIASAPLMAAQEQSRLSDDIIATYTSMIAANPGSSELYLSRATEYASRGLLAPALSDLNDALRLAHAGDKELRYELLTRRAAILESQLNYTEALADLDSASALVPDAPPLLLSRARILAALGRYDEARDCYNSFRRRDPRSPEAIFGLARVYAAQGDTDRSLAMMNEGIEADPRAGSSYVAAAAIQSALGRDDDAVAYLVSAIGCGDDGAATALQRLVDMSYDSYPLVMRGLDAAINRQPSAGELYYIRGTIAQDHDHHRSALADLTIIDGSGPFAGGVLGETVAQSLLALGDTDAAIGALGKVPAGARGASWHTLMSTALLRSGMPDKALESAATALGADPSHIPALEAKARALMELGRGPEAAAEISGALMADAASYPVLYYLGASLASGKRRDALIEEAALLPYGPTDPASLTGFALMALGKTDEATVWASSVSRFATASDGVADFTAAALYANAGMPDEALRYLEKALKTGYDNRHLLLHDTTPGISLAPLRGDSRFNTLIETYLSPAR